MKTWNTHAWYITAILSSLLIGSVSVQWNTIPGLAGIISFALGLSSLLLAIIAIVQALTASGNVEGGLSAVRQGADNLERISSSLAAAASDVQAMSRKMLESSTENRQALIEIKQEIQANANRQVGSEINRPIEDNGSDIDLLNQEVTYGGTIAIYALAVSKKNCAEFKFSDLFLEDEDVPSSDYFNGYTAALPAFTKTKIQINGITYKATDLLGQEDRIIESSRSIKFANPKLNDKLPKILQKVDEFFDFQPSAAAAG